MRQVRGGLPGKGHQHQAAEIVGGRLALRIRIAPRSATRSLCSVGASTNSRCSSLYVVPSRCLLQAMAFARPLKIALAKPRALCRPKSPAASAAGLFCARGPRLRLLPARLFSQNAIRLRFNTRRVADSVMCSAVTWGNAFDVSGATAPGAIKTQTYRVSRPPAACPQPARPFRAAGACNVFASAEFRACFASVEALLTRTLSGCPRTSEPTMQTVQTDRSTFAR